MKARILWVEGKRAESPSFVPEIRKKDYHVEVVPSGTAALKRLVDIDPDVIVINAASFGTSGKRICRELRARLSEIPILLIASARQPVANDTGANVVLSLPFTARKVLNRITPFLPGDGQLLLHVGPIRLDMEKKRLRCQGREARLTPHLTHLLQVLLTHPGEVVLREDLFRQVWHTEYTGDTRTLDVHISWLRHALEENPRKPRFLKTIRGKGFRLDV